MSIKFRLSHYAWFNPSCYHPLGNPRGFAGFLIAKYQFPTPGQIKKANFPPRGQYFWWARPKPLVCEHLYSPTPETRRSIKFPLPGTVSVYFLGVCNLGDNPPGGL